MNKLIERSQNCICLVGVERRILCFCFISTPYPQFRGHKNALSSLKFLLNFGTNRKCSECNKTIVIYVLGPGLSFRCAIVMQTSRNKNLHNVIEDIKFNKPLLINKFRLSNSS